MVKPHINVACKSVEQSVKATEQLFFAGPLHSHMKVLAAGLKTYEIPPDFSGNHDHLFVVISMHSRS